MSRINMKFTWNYIELCKSTDKQAHYFISEAERSCLPVVEINNRHYALIINEMVWRAPDAEFKNVESATYVFRD